MHDVRLNGVETCRGPRYRYQTPRNLLIYRSRFGNYERVTDSFLKYDQPPVILTVDSPPLILDNLSLQGRQLLQRD